MPQTHQPRRSYRRNVPVPPPTSTFPATPIAAAHTLHVEVSPSIAGTLFSALDYLTSYPYGCTEQTMSSFLPNVIVAETLKKLNLSGHIDPADLQAKIQRRPRSPRRLPARRWRLGLVERRHEPRLHDRLCRLRSRRSGELLSFAVAARAATTANNICRTQLAQHPRMIPDLRAYVVYALAESGAGESVQPAQHAVVAPQRPLRRRPRPYRHSPCCAPATARAAQTRKLLEAKARHTGDLAPGHRPTTRSST